MNMLKVGKDNIERRSRYLLKDPDITGNAPGLGSWLDPLAQAQAV